MDPYGNWGYQSSIFDGPPPSVQQTSVRQRKVYQGPPAAPPVPTPMKEENEKRFAVELAFVKPLLQRMAEAVGWEVKRELTKNFADRKKKLVIYFSKVPPPIICGDRNVAGHKVPDELRDTPSYMSFVTRMVASGVIPNDVFDTAIQKQNVDPCLDVLMFVMSPIMSKLQEILSRPENASISMEPMLLTAEGRSLPRGRACGEIANEWAQFAKTKWQEELERVTTGLAEIPDGDITIEYKRKSEEEIKKIREERAALSRDRGDQGNYGKRRKEDRNGGGNWGYDDYSYDYSYYSPQGYGSRPLAYQGPPMATPGLSPYQNKGYYGGYGGQRPVTDSRLSLDAIGGAPPPPPALPSEPPTERLMLAERVHKRIQELVDSINSRFAKVPLAPVYNSPVVQKAIRMDYTTLEEAEDVFHALGDIWVRVSRQGVDEAAPVAPATPVAAAPAAVVPAPPSIKMNGKSYSRIEPENYTVLQEGQEVMRRSSDGTDFQLVTVARVKNGKVAIECGDDLEVVQAADLYILG